MSRLPMLLAAAAILAAAAPAAHAQSSGDRGSGSNWMEMDDQDSGRWSNRDDQPDQDQFWGRHSKRWAGRDQGDDDRGGSDRSMMADHAQMQQQMQQMQRFGGGARFMLRSGDVRLAVQCGRGETMKDCVEATILLMDKARAQSRSGGTDAPAASPNPPATAPQQ